MADYDVGDKLYLRAEFMSPTAATHVDPDQVRFLVRAPGGNVATYTHGSASQVGKEAVGVYYTEPVATGPGTWNYRAVATGTWQAAEETSFAVASSVF